MKYYFLNNVNTYCEYKFPYMYIDDSGQRMFGIGTALDGNT